jgi:DNA polymerase III sliding clamp (beta) subunit (PCNA family)
MICLPVGELKPALAGLAKVISRKASLECLRCVKVEAASGEVTLAATDLDLYAKVNIPAPDSEPAPGFLVPFEALQSAVRRLPPRSRLRLAPGHLACELEGSTVGEAVTAPEVSEFPTEPELKTRPVPLPEGFGERFGQAFGCSSTDESRYVLNGVHLDTSERGCHHLIGTDGRHLFSANSFTLPLRESLTVPNHRFLTWRGLTELPWAAASEQKDGSTWVRFVVGSWTVTFKAIEGNYPNWRIVVPNKGSAKTTVTLPEGHDFGRIVRGLPGADDPNKPVLLAVGNGTLSVGTTSGKGLVPLPGATVQGPDLRISLNRDYLVKAFDYGLNRIALIDPRSPLHFTCEGRQMVVMPLRLTEAEAPEAPPTQPAPPEPQPERKPMTATTAAPAAHNGASRSTSPTAKPAIEAALDKLEASKTDLRDAVSGLTELATLLKQSVRDQKAGEKEIQQVRQTLRSLQSVRI